MNSGIRSDDFAARLRRIEENRRQNAGGQRGQPHKTTKTQRDDPLGMRNAVIAAFLAIIIGTGGYVAWKLTSAELIQHPPRQSSDQ